MRVLVVKLTSMGDVLHLMPALSDLLLEHPQLTVDWMVEDSFAELPHWHASVDRVIPVSTRRWGKLTRQNWREFRVFWRSLREQQYDFIIDAQGLMKSAVFARFGKLKRGGKRIGFSGDSIKESPAAYLYKQRVKVPRELHAIDRLRQLFAGGFCYQPPSSPPNYAIKQRASLNLESIHPGLGSLDPDLQQARSASSKHSRSSIFLLHATTWPSKHLPDQMWRDLAQLITDDGYQVKLCWGNQAEKQRANWIAENRPNITVLPKSSLNELATQLALASGAIAVDTGLGHMAAALSTPCVSLYGATNARLTGTVGIAQLHRQTEYPCSPCLLKHCDKLDRQSLSPHADPPCYATLQAADIWQRLREQIV